tara:strand:+ start:1105 stop:2730 length:1626 start_codon:yes stop_codon:yes gene_type:complete
MAVEKTDFIRQRIQKDVDQGTLEGGVITRFPPEPNGHLHIGHAKSICLNFGVAKEFGGKTFLRFDDTNPLKESEEYVSAIQADIEWLGFQWSDVTFASDHFEEIYQYAVDLISEGKAYVCSLSPEEIRVTRGTLKEPGVDSPFRARSVAENIDLFKRMRDGEFKEGEHVVRLKIDMSSPNINLRDPVIYRIIHASHHRTGDDWCIYPMYDFTHCICDALERISHSLCTLEFEDHRPLYDWVLDNISVNYHPPQIEFSRLGLEYTVMSKRLLNSLVDEKFVDGWNDPRMPTVSGLRRRGVPARAIRDFCDRIGVTKQENTVEMNLLEFCIRADLEKTAPRGMCVLNPLKVVLTNLPENEIERLSADWHPQNPELGSREILFGRNLYIEKEDFLEDPPAKFKRLTPGGMVRLRYGFIIRCDEAIYDETGGLTHLNCTYFPESRSGQDKSGLKARGVIHWVDANSCELVSVRQYGRLFDVPMPKSADFVDHIDKNSLVESHGLLEKAVMEKDIERIQFERIGYFYRDPDLPRTYNKTVSLREGF